MKVTCGSFSVLAVLLAGFVTPVAGTPVAYWTFDSSVTADTITGDGSQDLDTAGNDSSSIVQNADVPGPSIFDPLTSTTRANSNSVIMTGNKTLTGGNQSDNGTARLQTTGSDLQGVNESFTFETFLKVSNLSLNNGNVSILGQYSNSAGSGGTNEGWLSQLRPLDGTPDTLTFIDLDDGNNPNDGVVNAPWTSNPTADGGWHHVAWVYDQSSGEFAHYVDYAMVASATIDTSTFDYERNQVLQFGVRFISNVNTEGETSEVTLLFDEARYSTSALDSSDFLVAVPEPSSLLLIVCAGLGLLGRRRFRATK